MAIAAEIILISAWARQVDVRRVTVVQLATASLVAFAAMAPAGESIPPMRPELLAVALGLGIFSAIIQVTMNWAQRSVSPTRATLIYTGEPVCWRVWSYRRRASAAVGAGGLSVYSRRSAGQRAEVEENRGRRLRQRKRQNLLSGAS